MPSFFGIADHVCSTAKRLVAPAFSAALDFVYPPECLLCGVEIDEGRPTFCEPCQSKLKPRLTDECIRCGAPVGPYADLTKGCGQCRRESFAFDRVVRLGVYDGEMRLACLRAKATGGSSVARALAEVLVAEKRKVFEELSIDIAVPIPEHWTRRFLHSHYAAETVSREISSQLHVDWSRTLLTKLRRTPKQATSPTPSRRRQQQGSFGVNRNVNLSGKVILVIDDILTTGSTASAAARALKQAGAKQVVVAVIAVSPLRK